MILVEILDKPADYKVTAAKPDKFWASAMINGREIAFAAESAGHAGGKEHWEMSFQERRPTSFGKIKSGTFQLTGSRGEFQVFATWKKFMEEFLQRYKPDVVYFTADKDHSRADLYEKLLKRFKMPGYRTIRREQNGKQDRFEVERVDEGLSESQSYRRPPLKEGVVYSIGDVTKLSGEWLDDADLREIWSEWGPVFTPELLFIYHEVEPQQLQMTREWQKVFTIVLKGERGRAEDKKRFEKILELVKRERKLWPVVVNGDGDEMLCGYHRLMAYMKLGIKKIPAIYIEEKKD